MMNRRMLVLLLALSIAGCASAPLGPPAAVVVDLISYLDAGATRDADDLMSRVALEDGYSERIYPVLFETARERYESGDPPGAARVLRLMVGSYPQAIAVREALAYSLFMQRATLEQPDPALTEELKQTLTGLEGQTGASAVWLDLVGVQLAIDGGQLDEARAYLLRFLDAWDGQPPSLLVYVEDLERYLRSH